MQSNFFLAKTPSLRHPQLPTTARIAFGVILTLVRFQAPPQLTDAAPPGATEDSFFSQALGETHK